MGTLLWIFKTHYSITASISVCVTVKVIFTLHIFLRIFEKREICAAQKNVRFTYAV